MPKSRFETVLDEVWDKIDGAADEDEEEQKSIEEMDPDEFYATLDLDDMIDRQRAYNAYQWVKANLHVTAIQEEDKDGDILHYEDGIWRENGGMRVDRVANQLMKEYTSTNVSKELRRQHIKVESETNVESDTLGLSNGKVAVKNGLLNLEVGEIERDLRPDDYAITQIPHEFHPDAKCPTWGRFITQSVEPGKQQLIQEYAGYCLARGIYPYPKALMLLGDGNNGKTTFLNAVEELLGADENTMNADLSELAGGRFSAYRLEGKLANINADIENAQIEHTSMFKNMTGGDPFQVEQKYGDPYDHKNSAKLIFAANRIPDVDTEEHAFFKRWLLVRFPHTFTRKDDDGNPDVDPDLEDKLAEEMEGILAWAVEGYQRLIENNGQFTNALSPEQVREQWYSYANPMDEFCRQYLYEDQAESFTEVDHIYQKYLKFMEDQPSSPANKKQLTSYLKKRFDNHHHGIKKKRTDDGSRKSVRAFGGLHLKPEKR
jgi:putative DNA primase/helicase